MKLKIKSSSIEYFPSDFNYDDFWQLSVNGEVLTSFSSREEAEDRLNELKHTVVLMIKSVGNYFRGIIIKTQFSEGERWIVACTSWSGGGDDAPPLEEILNFKAATEDGLLAKLISFKKKHKLLIDGQKQIN